jgi:hypothetical protein
MAIDLFHDIDKKVFDISGTEKNPSTFPNENNKDIIKNSEIRRNALCSYEISSDN